METMEILLALEQCQMTYNLGKYNDAIAAAMELIQQQGERLAALEQSCETATGDKRFPKKEMDELIAGLRAWRAEVGSPVHKAMTAAHRIEIKTGVAAIKWLNLIDAICSGVAVDAGDEVIYEALRVLGCVPDAGNKKGMRL